MASLESHCLSTPVRKIYIAYLAVILLFCTGCQTAYIFHAASNEFSLLRNSIKIKDALKIDSLNSEIKSKLRLVPEIKKFGEDNLGLKKTGSYETAYIKAKKFTVYVLTACPKDSLKIKTWWFPIVGKMPYLGFFDLKNAIKEKEKLIKEGMDVNIGIASAYSTLGWFNDPVTLNLLRGSTVTLVETILHEMTHATLFIKGDGEFNEGLANLVGKAGAIAFFREKYGRLNPFTIEAENNLFDERLFSNYINSLIESLSKLYNSDLSYSLKIRQRKGIFTSYYEKFSRLKNEFRTNRFKDFGKYGLNNAYILSIGLYTRDFPLFERMLAKNNNSISSMINSLKNRKKIVTTGLH